MRRRAPRAIVATATLLVAASLLAACGDDEEEEPTTTAAEATTDGAEGREGYSAPDSGDGDEGAEAEDGGPSDAEQVEAAIEAVLADDDNERVCNEVLSENLLATAYGDLQGCLNGRRPVTLADGIRRLRDLEVDGDTATLIAIPDGGIYDEVELEVTAVRDGEDWRIDQLRADLPVGP